MQCATRPNMHRELTTATFGACNAPRESSWILVNHQLNGQSSGLAVTRWNLHWRRNRHHAVTCSLRSAGTMGSYFTGERTRSSASKFAIHVHRWPAEAKSSKNSINSLIWAFFELKYLLCLSLSIRTILHLLILISVSFVLFFVNLARSVGDRCTIFVVWMHIERSTL